MFAITLALVAALAYGSSDFAGGVASRSQHYAVVNLTGQVIAFLAVWIATLLTGGQPTGQALGWGALAGLGSALGTLSLYRGLARGRMSIVAPLSAGVAAVIPVGCGFVLGNSPSTLADLGVLVALPAIVLISTTSTTDGGDTRTSIRDGVLAGVGFGFLFIGLSRTGSGAGLWPTAASASTSLALIAMVAAPVARRGAAPLLRGRPTALAVLGGLLGACGTTSFMVASRTGMLALVSVIASLYPAVTVVLARSVLHERIARLQTLGLTLAGVGIACIAAG